MWWGIYSNCRFLKRINENSKWYLEINTDLWKDKLYWEILVPQTGKQMLEKTEGSIKNGQSRETGNTMYTRYRTRTSKPKTTTHKTKPMSNTDPTKLLKWTESGGQVSRDDRIVGIWQANKQQKINLISKHTFEALNCVLYCTFSASVHKV